MPLLLQDVNFEDGVPIANIYISAFYDDPFNKTLFPGISFVKQVAGVISRWPGNYGSISAHYKKVIDSESGKIISYSKWSFAFTEAGGTLREPQSIPDGVEIKPPSTPEGLNDPFAIAFTEKVDELRKRILGDCPQLQLKMMGTHPSHQRQGAASLQLSWAVDVADQHGLTCWVEASPVSVSVYQKFGFEVKGHVDSELDESCGGGVYRYTCMLRQPKNVS
ncbi:hypothetical protein VTL71DRAFT_6676 [Oculimacula yallundae]|uniref:N-acetyltransferase domain-containing protein n=1 Tax=Oculimacula yallundae TaxID=86028 RepID=A0ABR4BXL4_9HELO